MLFVEGLSPRVRGNRSGRAVQYSTVGSIPACTGKPITVRPKQQLRQVYPRVYGETKDDGSFDMVANGLSPRVRGNRWQAAQSECSLRSIPACTGKPSPLAQAPVAVRVYPRVYGETAHDLSWSVHLGGLSPRVRGNRA